MLDPINDCAINKGKTYLCKYVSADTACKILTNLEGKWSSPLLFNDPFDMQIGMRFDFEHEDVQEPLLNEYIRLTYHDKDVVLQNINLGPYIELARAKFQSIPPKELRRILKVDPKSNLSDIERELEEYNTWWQNFIRDIRVFCVVEKHDNILMWSHYSKYHTGAVIKYKLIPEPDTDLCAALPIQYISRRKLPTIASLEEYVQHLTGQKPLDIENIGQTYFLTKSNHWKYEKEWRVFKRSRNTNRDELFEFFKFLPEEFDTIYLGCRMEDQEKENIMRCLNSNLSHVKVYKAKKVKQNMHWILKEFSRLPHVWKEGWPS
jgi:hypothetical protein